MNQSLQDLLELMALERLEHNLFRGESRDIVGPRVFGGQVLGQALMAAAQTVDEARGVHSFHGYFLRPGDMADPIVYDVDRIRDGGSFTTRRVVAIQHGRAIFNMAASFQVRESGVDHQSAMPEVPAPEDLPTDKAVLEAVWDQVPPYLRDRLSRERPFEMRPVGAVNFLEPEVRPPHQAVWLRAAGSMPEDPRLHHVVLAFASDFNLLGVALLPHGRSLFQPDIQAASLDHVMWFHREFRMDDWLLYAMDSPSASNARGFSRGSLYSRDGRLVASVAQEGLMRLRPRRS